jgi:hypothetical protein
MGCLVQVIVACERRVRFVGSDVAEVAQVRGEEYESDDSDDEALSKHHYFALCEPHDALPQSFIYL